MTNPEAQALEIEIKDLETQLKAKQDRLQRIRWTCAHAWGETKRQMFTYVGARTMSWSRTCDICGYDQYRTVDADLPASKVF